MVKREDINGRRGQLASRRNGAAASQENYDTQASQRNGIASQQSTQRGEPSSQRGQMSQLEVRRRPLAGLSLQQSRQASQEASRVEDEAPRLDVSNQETDKLVSEVVRHMLFKNHQQPGVPVRRDDLVQLITQTYKQRNLAGTVIAMAQTRMKVCFGMEMKEYIRMKSTKGSNAAAQGDSKEYVLESNLPESFVKKYVETPDTAVEKSLAVLLVGIIKFAGVEKVPEATVLQNLRGLGINDLEQPHPVFGNVKQGLEAVVKQRYIHKEKLSGHDGSEFVYELAERALDPDFQARFDVLLSKIVPREFQKTPE